MSFYINNTNPNRPGPISGNAVNGVCEKVLIEATKIFDACICQTTESGILLITSNYNPANPAFPLTYISAENDPYNEAILSNVIIDRSSSCSNYATVTATVSVPLIVTYRDANGVIGSATSNLTFNKSVMLFVPEAAFTPIQIKAKVNFSSSIGQYTGTNTFTVTGCIQIIIKVTADVDILIPSFGYPTLPPCQSPAPNACPGLPDLPLYPTAAVNPNCPRG